MKKCGLEPQIFYKDSENAGKCNKKVRKTLYVSLDF